MRMWAGIGCLLLALGVGMGAFGAHGLRSVLSAEMMVIYEKSVLYHFIHAFAVVLTAVVAQSFDLSARLYSRVCLGFTFGIILFSGSLYALTITGVRWLGAVTPFGGTLWIVCWIILGLKLSKR